MFCDLESRGRGNFGSYILRTSRQGDGETTCRGQSGPRASYSFHLRETEIDKRSRELRPANQSLSRRTIRESGRTWVFGMFVEWRFLVCGGRRAKKHPNTSDVCNPPAHPPYLVSWWTLRTTLKASSPRCYCSPANVLTKRTSPIHRGLEDPKGLLQDPLARGT